MPPFSGHNDFRNNLTLNVGKPHTNLHGVIYRKDLILIIFLYNKTNICTNFPNLFLLKNVPLHVSGSFSAHHQEFIHCKLGTGICHTGLKKAFFKPV